MDAYAWRYSYRRGICATFILSYILLVMVENLQCSITRNIRSVTDLYPWQASLYYKNESEVQNRICSAALISDNAVITAAHCIHNKLRQNLTVSLCNSSIHININETKYFNYNPATYHDDIAILILKKNETIPGEQQPMKFDQDPDLEYEDIAYFKSYKDDKIGTIEIKGLHECGMDYPKVSYQICGRVKASELSKGDSGGIMWMKYNGEDIAIGITSFLVDLGCTTENCFVVITSLKYYNITGNINQ